MFDDRTILENTEPVSMVGWLRQALRPWQPAGDYYETLRRSVESSAPVCVDCR